MVWEKALQGTPLRRCKRRVNVPESVCAPYYYAIVWRNNTGECSEFRSRY